MVGLPGSRTEFEGLIVGEGQGKRRTRKRARRRKRKASLATRRSLRHGTG